MSIIQTSRRKSRKKGHLLSPSWILLHVVCLAIYIFPVFVETRHNLRRDAVLDELHIVSAENRDVNGDDTTLTQIFTNDYWGRPMTSPSSHKSWRPLTVLSFRYLKGGPWMRDLDAYRLVNIILHAATAEAVGIIGMQLLPEHSELFRGIVKLVFALHPTHVEVTANAANRGHLIAVLCSSVAADPRIHWLILMAVVVVGYLSSETFLFQVFPAAVTLTAIVHIRHHRQRIDDPASLETIRKVFRQVLPRVLFLLSSGVVYFGLRHYFDTLSIPDGLIRPAENPFFTLEGWDRFRSYAYVLSLHVGKAWDLDWIGFSHEYGQECLRPVTDWEDPRLYIPQTIMIIYALAAMGTQVRPFSVLSWWYIVHVAWMTSLVPISGLIKVGTFVSDRIVVAASVSTSLCVAWLVWSWLRRPPVQLKRYEKIALLALVTAAMYRRVHNRSLEWMDSLSLLESSLKTCPRFGKAHLEISKIYSGVYPEKLNYAKSLYHIKQAQECDPDHCDVHYQFAHVAVLQRRYQDMERHLVDALQCPYSMSGALRMWQQYWPAVLDPSPPNTPEMVAAAQARHDSYVKVIQQAIAREETATPNAKSSSPFAQWTGSH